MLDNYGGIVRVGSLRKPPMYPRQRGTLGKGFSTRPRHDDSSFAQSRLIVASLQAYAHELSQMALSMSDELARATSPEDLSRVASRLAVRSIPRWHFAMLNDTERNQALAAAVERLAQPGSHVLDIGSGTGLLAMMAARVGAERVTSCEANPLLAEIARQVVAAHGLSDVISIVTKHSTELEIGVDIERPADLIVSEIVDCGLVGEGLLPTIRHAREHLLAPEGRLMPRAAQLHGFLIDSEVADGLNRVDTASGFDVRPLNIVATPGHFPLRLRTWPHRVLSETVQLVHFDLATDPLVDGARRVSLPIAADGWAHGLVAWFEMDLGPGVVIRNSPDKLESHWMQALLPFEQPRPVTAGGRLDLELRWQDKRLTARMSN